MNKKNDEKTCPICKKSFAIIATHKYGPFCSERCQMIDLGQWLKEKYVVSSNNKNEDKEDESK